MKSPWEFEPRGESGLPISDLYPHLSKHADDLCLLNGAHTDIPNHPQALVQLHTGNFQFVRPSVGAWVLYGLGTENQDLPGFITIKPPARLAERRITAARSCRPCIKGRDLADDGNARRTRSATSPMTLSGRPAAEAARFGAVDEPTLQDRNPTNTQMEGVIESYELAFRMQSAVPQ